jgi:hypothetical protein
VTLVDSTVADNVAGSDSPGGQGGGIDSGGKVTLTNSTVSGNRSIGSNGNQGGGISAGVLIATSSVISGNTAIKGRAGGAYGGSITLVNTTVSGNSVTGDGISTGVGGGLWFHDSDSGALKNVTIYGNSAPRASGIFVNVGAQMLNSLVAGGTGSAGCAGSIVSLGHNLESGDSCGFHGTGDLTNTDPKVGPLVFNGGPTMTHALQPGSPAIDAGDGTTCPATDQRGASRPVDGDGNGAVGCDIGGFEVPPWPCGTLRSVRVAVAPDGPNRLRATLTSVPGTGAPPNTVKRLRITGLSNVVVDVGSQTYVTPGVDVPISPNTQQVVLIIRRPSGQGPGTARLLVTDTCGDWPTFVGGGVRAWSGGGTASVPSEADPIRSAAPASPPACTPSVPHVRMTTRKLEPGSLEATLIAETTPGVSSNSLSSVRIGPVNNATAKLDGVPVMAGQTVALATGTQRATLTLERHAPAQDPGRASMIGFTVTDVCGDWNSFVGGGPSAFR